MKQNLVRLLAVSLTALSLAACAMPGPNAAVQPPPGPSPSNVNPITGVRGGGTPVHP